MNADLRFEDHQRAGRGVIATLDGDDLALAATLSDCLHDPAENAVTKMLLASWLLASDVLVAAVGSVDEARDTLRAAIASLTAAADRDQDDDA